MTTHIEEWLVLMTDHTEVRVMIGSDLRNDMVKESVAMSKVRVATSKRPFCAKPKKCTGLAWNTHFGAENACPIHGGNHNA